MLAAAAMHCGAKPACAQKAAKASASVVGAGAAPAPHPQHADARHKMQSISRRAQGEGKLRGHCIFCKARRRAARNGPVGCEPHRSARQQCAADLFDALRLQHGIVLVSGPFIHRKHTVCIRGSGNDRHRAAHSGQPPRQLVGPARWPERTGTAKRPHSSSTTTAGSDALLLQWGAMARTANAHRAQQK